MADDLTLFAHTLTQLAGSWEVYRAACAALQEEWDAQILAEYRSKFPKRKRPEAHKARVALGRDGADDPVYLEFRSRAVALDEERVNRETALEEQLRTLAPHVEIPRTPDLQLRHKVSSDEYRSQGFGAGKYAQAAAQRLADDALRAGLRAEVRVLETSMSGGVYPVTMSTFGVFADTTEIGWEVVRRLPPLSLRDWLKSCWKAGVNPRVMNPFLPHDIEGKLGVSYSGDDVDPAPARALSSAS